MNRNWRRDKTSAHNPRITSEGSSDRPEGVSRTAFFKHGDMTRSEVASRRSIAKFLSEEAPETADRDAETQNLLYGKLINYAFFLLGRRRYTYKEMADKLKRKCAQHFAENFGAVECKGTAAKVLNRLVELKYINDDEYVADFISSRMKLRPKGKRGLTFELRKKGICGEMVEKYFEENPIDEDETAMRLAREKLEKLGKLPQEKKRSKIIMFLNSRGFNAHTIYEVIDKIFNQ